MDARSNCLPLTTAMNLPMLKTGFQAFAERRDFAAGFFVGTPTAAKYVPLAEAGKVPVVGLFTGAEMLYSPLKHYVMNVRASYTDETREQVEKFPERVGDSQDWRDLPR